MSQENTDKLMAFYMEGLILDINTMYMVFCFFKLFLVGCIGLMYLRGDRPGPPTERPDSTTSQYPAVS